MKRFVVLTLLFLVAVGCGYHPFEGRHYTIGRDETWYPLSLDSKAAPLTAFTTILLQEIAHLEHFSLQIINIEPPQLMRSLEEKQVNGILTMLTPSSVNEQTYSFSHPIVPLGPVLIVPYSSTVCSLDQLEGKIVGVYQYDQSILLAQKYPSIVIQLYQSMPAVLEDLQRGLVDGVLMPNLDARTLVFNRFSGQVKIVTGPLSPEAIRLITLKGQNEGLIQKFNKGLKKLDDRGTYGHLRHLYQLD